MSHSSPTNKIISSPATYAFITHSPITLPNNLPPDVDNELLARRRRRRTSQHDQTILEDEFKINERPDKYARREIMKKIDLGEREIQIWFQNRRQTNRRKSKPLQAHEMSTPKSRSRFDLSSDMSTPNIASKTDAIKPDNRIARYASSRPTSPTLCELSFQTPLNRQSITSLLNENVDVSVQKQPFSDALNLDSSPTSLVTLNKENRAEHMLRKTSPIHYLLNAESIGEQASDDYNKDDDSSQATLPDTSMSNCSTVTLETNTTVDSSPMPIDDSHTRRRKLEGRPPRLLKRSSSAIRLSMSLDGKASVIMEDDETTLSLPSSQTSTTMAEPAGPKRKIVDAKVWEICCDSQSSVPSEKSTDESPRKALKIIRARGVVAAAKEAASKRQKTSTRSTRPQKADGKSTILAPRSPNKPLMKTKTPTRMSDKLKLQARNNMLKTPLPKLPSLKMISMTSSPPKASYSSFQLYSESGYGSSPLKLPITKEELDSDKENRDPDGNYIHQVPAADKAYQRRVLGNMKDEDVVPEGEMECIENLLSLRGALWTQ